MRFNLQKSLFWVLVLSAFSISAFAGPIQWNFSGVTFTDGGTLTGSFTYNADTATFTNVDVTISGSTTPAFNVTMLFDDPAFSSAIDFEASSALPATVDVTPSIYTAFSSAMTDAGGTIPILLGGDSYDGICSDTTCSTYISAAVDIASGSITASSSVPEPGSWATLGLGLIGLAALKLRHRPARS
jgi:hypothetical protein